MIELGGDDLRSIFQSYNPTDWAFANQICEYLSLIRQGRFGDREQAALKTAIADYQRRQAEEN